MRVLSCLAARGGLVAVLMMVLAILVAPTSGLAGTPDAHSEIIAVADDRGAGTGHAAHEGTHDRFCHPDPTCSPAAILMARAIFGAHAFRALRPPLAQTEAGGRNAPVDLPPPRTGTGLQSPLKRHDQA